MQQLGGLDDHISAPHSPSGMGSWVFPVAAWLGGIPGPPQSHLRDFVPCTLYLMAAEPALEMFSSPFLQEAPSHLLLGRAAELREMGAVCPPGAHSCGMTVGFVDFSELTTC